FGEALVAVPLLALLIPVEVAAPLAVLVSITVPVVIVLEDWLVPRERQVTPPRRSSTSSSPSTVSTSCRVASPSRQKRRSPRAFPTRGLWTVISGSQRGSTGWMVSFFWCASASRPSRARRR